MTTARAAGFLACTAGAAGFGFSPGETAAGFFSPGETAAFTETAAAFTFTGAAPNIPLGTATEGGACICAFVAAAAAATAARPAVVTALGSTFSLHLPY